MAWFGSARNAGLGFELGEKLKQTITEYSLEYRELTTLERDNYILHVINVLTGDITKAGDHRIMEWENGWGENLNKFIKTKNIDDLIPRYHGKNRIVRWMGDVVMPITENFDYKIHICFVDAILQHYLKNVDNVFEFGCGPAYHLIRLKEFNKCLNLNGSDWTKSSQDIIKEINKVLDTNINGFNLNFFTPNNSIDIPKSSGIYTVAALEQVGDNFKEFVNFLIEKKPKICIHMEPIDELLNDDIILIKSE